ncbi:MAG TPA: choice-of-anchor L domain-containing protein [Bacteroidia bacterium]|nr:choice-of-anchor L domain-containing protein [Bacteroidia bacterium]
MKKIQLPFLKVISLLAIILLVFSINVNAQLTTKRSGNYGLINYLVNKILLGSGITATNITYQGIDTSFGFFNGTKSNIGMDSGVVITNGTITLCDGPNAKSYGNVSDGANTTYRYPASPDGWPSSNTYNDSDLANLIGTTYSNTYSCAILQFDFVAVADSIQFQYSFGSNEEPHYVGSKYLDDFGFFLSGPGIAGPFSHGAINLALVPKTTTAVYINSVNCTTNSAYYVCNYPSSTGCSSCPATLAATTVGYNGFTTVLTAKASVQCGKKYHIKLGVGNIGNGKFDSGVFLKAGSFTPTTNPMTVAATTSTICSGNSTTITATGATSYTWSPGTGLSSTTGSSVTANPSTATTYTVIGVITGACDDTAKITIAVNPTPTVTVSPTSPAVCPGGSVTLAAGGASIYTWKPGTGLSATTGSSVTATPATTTTYTVTGISVAGCKDSAQVTVTVSPTLVVTVTPSNPAICSGSSTTLNASGAANYTWSPGTGLSCTNCSGTIANPTITTTYTVVGTSGSCADTTHVTITVNPTPTLTVSPSTTICFGTNTKITVSGATSYSWSPATTLSCSSCPNPTATPTTATTYTVIGTNGSCNDTATVSITINPKPTVSVTPSSPFICTGGNTTLTASGASTYAWSPGTGLSATTGTTVTANPASTTTYTLIGTSTSGCNDTINVTVTVSPSLNVTVSPSSPTICSGSSTSLTASGALTYTWSPGTSLNSTTGTTVIANPSTTTTYTVVGTSGTCTDTAQVTITVNPTPTITISPNTSICAGGSTILTAGGATSYTWSPTGGLSCTSCPNPTANPGSTITYTVTGTSSGCTGKDSVTVTVNPLPVINVTPPNPSVCPGSNVTLTASGANTYSWKPGSSLSSTTGTVVTASPSSATTYTIIGTSSLGCIDSNTVTITINPVPIVVATATDSSICYGNSTTLNASGAINYTWTPSSSLACSVCASTLATPSGTTTYTLVGVNSSGCTDSTQIAITVNPNPVITISLSGNDTVCQGQSITMTASGATSYIWSPSTGLTCTSCPNPTVTPSSSPVTYTVIGSTGKCSDTASQVLYQYPKLNLTIHADSVCFGSSTQVSAIVTGGKPGYAYNWNNGLGTGTGPFTISPTIPIYYVCSVTDGCSITLKDSAQVIVSPLPKAAFSASPDTIMGGQYVTFVNLSTGATTYFWNLGDGSTSTDSSVYHQYNPTGPFVVYLVSKNAQGCSDTAWDSIYVVGGIWVPNVFTPNGDGQNDVFHVKAGGMKTYDIEIFNRWGEKLFEANSPAIDWTGRSSAGVEESDGTYFYIITATDYSNKNYKLNGYLQLIR